MVYLVGIFFVCWLLKLSWVDLKTGRLPDAYTLPLLWLGLLSQPFLPWGSFQNAVWGAAGGYGFLWLIYWGFRLFFHKEGMGYGDFKFLAALGAWLGWAALPCVLSVASFSTLIGGLSLRAMKKAALAQEIPFGPGLALGGVSLFLYQGLTLI